MTSISPPELLEQLDATPRRVMASLQGLPRALLLWTPGPGRWSLAELAGHWRDCESQVFLAAYRRIVAEDRPALADADPDQCGLESDARRVRVAEVLRAWRRARRETVAFLAALPAAAWDREAMHPVHGVVTLHALVNGQVRDHDHAHVREIDRIQERYGILSRLEDAPREMRRLVEDIPAGLHAARPFPGRWSIVEHICHLRDRDQLAIRRFTRMVRSERPRMQELDGQALALAGRYAEQNAGEALREWERRRQQLCELLHVLDHAAWQRRALHPRHGEATIAELVAHLLDHDAAHAAHVRALRQALMPQAALVQPAPS
jgi:hypothetical protein